MRCEICGNKADSNRCWRHKQYTLQRKPIKKRYTKKSPEEVEITNKMFQLFEEIWEERGPYSEVSGTYLGKECKSIFCHHILPKSPYPKLTLIKENIILLTFEEHQLVEQNPSAFEEITRREQELKVKYGK